MPPRIKKTLGVRGKRHKRDSDSDATVADDDIQVQPPQPLAQPKKKQSKAKGEPKGVSAKKPAKGKWHRAVEVVEESDEEEEEEEDEEESDVENDSSSQLQPPAKKKAKKAKKAGKKNTRPKAQKVKLQSDREVELLDALKLVPALWSSGHEYLHFTKENKTPMWKKLGEPYDLSVEQMKQWYKNIRTQLGKYTDLPPSGSGAVKLTPRAQFIVQHASFLKGQITRIVSRVKTTLRYDRQKMDELETKRSFQAPLHPSLSTTSASQEVSASQGTPAFPSLGSDAELEVEEEEASTSTGITAGTSGTAAPVRPRSTTPVTARVYPQNRSKTSETNRLNNALQDQIRTTLAMQAKLTAWQDKHTVAASNERLLFHQYVGQTSLRIDECHWNAYRRDINAVMDKYLQMQPPAMMNLSSYLNDQGTPVAPRKPPLIEQTPTTTAAAHSIVQGASNVLGQGYFNPAPSPLTFLSQLQTARTIALTAARACGIDFSYTGATAQKPKAVKVSLYSGEVSGDMRQSSYNVDPADPDIQNISQISLTQVRSTSPAARDLTTLECIQRGLIKCPDDMDEEEEGGESK